MTGPSIPDYILSVASIRQLEIEHQHVDLMGLAGDALFRRIQAIRGVFGNDGDDPDDQKPIPGLKAGSKKNLPVAFFIGKGNNGGDALIAAARLIQVGCPVFVWMAHDADESPPDSKQAWQKFCTAGGVAHDTLPGKNEKFLLIVDAIFGIGYSANRAITGIYKEAMDRINHLGVRSPVLAVDIPSGLDGQSGNVHVDDKGESCLVKADVTMSFIACKPGFFMHHGPTVCGSLYLDRLNLRLPDESASRVSITNGQSNAIPNEKKPPLAGMIYLNGQHAWQEGYQRRNSDFHKGHAGNVIIIGSSNKMPGAGQLAARAAISCGTGRVFLPPRDGDGEAGNQGVASGNPEIIYELPRDYYQHAKTNSCCVIGPGMGLDNNAGDLLDATIKNALCYRHSLVLDADALTLIADNNAESWYEGEFGKLILTSQLGQCPVVMTPHPLEAARLLGHKNSSAVQGERIEAACQIAAKYYAIVVLKGCGTVIAVPSLTGEGEGIDGIACWIQPGIAPALATAGSGDVLSGVIAAFIAQGMAHHHAVLAAVDLHCRAGQMLSDIGNSASGIIPAIKELLRGMPAN